MKKSVNNRHNNNPRIVFIVIDNIHVDIVDERDAGCKMKHDNRDDNHSNDNNDGENYS